MYITNRPIHAQVIVFFSMSFERESHKRNSQKCSYSSTIVSQKERKKKKDKVHYENRPFRATPDVPDLPLLCIGQRWDIYWELRFIYSMNSNCNTSVAFIIINTNWITVYEILLRLRFKDNFGALFLIFFISFCSLSFFFFLTYHFYFLIFFFCSTLWKV